MKTKLLSGLTVLNTRPQETSYLLTQEIEKLNGLSVDLPCIKISAKTDWLKTLPDLQTVHKAIFTSINAIDNFFPLLRESNITWPEHITNFAIGKGSANALSQQEIVVHAIPREAHSESLITHPMLQNVGNENILLIKGVGGRTVIFNYLQQKGANVCKIETYRRDLPDYSIDYLQKVQNLPIDILVFTSRESIINSFKIFPQNMHNWLLLKPCIVISKRQEDYAKELGFQTFLTSYDNIIETLINFKQGLQCGRE